MGNRTLIAGVGNVLLGDEGVGVHAVRALLEEGPPDGADVVDAGTALDALLPELHQYQTLILVDAVRGGGTPGAIYRMDVRSPSDLAGACRPLSLHEFGVAEALAEAQALGVLPRRVVLLGVEPGRIGPGLELSEAATAALPRLLVLIREEARSLLSHPDGGASPPPSR
jgi:hydrogenase maturation protease